MVIHTAVANFNDIELQSAACGQLRFYPDTLNKISTKTARLNCLCYTKCLYHALESKKRKGNNAGGDQRNRGVLKGFGYPGKQYPLP